MPIAEPRYRTGAYMRTARATTVSRRRRLAPDFRALRDIMAAARQEPHPDGGRTFLVALRGAGTFEIPEGGIERGVEQR